jgi:PRTRC genetic system protein C
MLIANQLPRMFHFEYKGTYLELADPSTDMQPVSVLNFYSQTYPELTTAKLEGPEIKNDRVVYTFQTTLGTKG